MNVIFKTKLSINDAKKKIITNSDNTLIDILFDTKIVISIIKGNRFVLITKTRRFFKKNFHSIISEENNGTVIRGIFKFNTGTTIFFMLSMVLTIGGLIYTYFNPEIIPDIEKREELKFILMSFLVFDLLLYAFRDFIGRKDIRIITKYIQDAIKAEKYEL